jgi:hypothetical protein
LDRSTDSDEILGVKISDNERSALPITRHDWHGDWNHTLATTPNDCATE